MLRMLIFRFWPAWIPLIVWLVWWYGWGRKKKKKGTLLPWQEKLWIWALGASFVLLVASMLVLGMAQERDTGGAYVPAEYKDGQLIPGHIVNEEAK
jgi:hypothetical protein